jgi:hypothetical protein
MGQPSIRRELGGNQKTESIELKNFSSETFPLSLGTLHKDILVCIFKNLNRKSIIAVIRTCKYFQSIWESVLEPDMCICYIGPGDADVSDQLLGDFEYPLKYILSDLKLGSWVKFKPVIQGIKNSRCSMKALFWVQENDVKDDTLQLLRQFIFECPQTPILFWKGNPILFEHVLLPHELEKLMSLEYLCISGGYLSMDWPQFFNQFPKLKCIYFSPSTIDGVSTDWILNTRTIFIMDCNVRYNNNIK